MFFDNNFDAVALVRCSSQTNNKTSMPLPYDIKEKFYKVINGEIALDDFEQWIYSNGELEKQLGNGDYTNLISLNFKKSSDKYALWKLLKKHIDPGEFETYKMLRLLREAQQKNDRLPYILMNFYNLYCNGYGFLQDLGLGFGLAVELPQVNNSTAGTWDELTSQQQKKLLESFSPELEECIEQVIAWLETRQIILTGEQNEIGLYGYEDFRTASERKSTLKINETAGFSVSPNTLPEKKQDEVLLIQGRKYKIENNLLVRVNRPLFSRKAVLELIEIGGMRYYRLSRSCYILYHYALYPCFDSYDYMHENRYFQAYYICRSLAEVQRKYDYLTNGKLFFVDLNPAGEYRPPLCPYVYYDEDKNLLRIYEDVKADSKPSERNIFRLCNDFVNEMRYPLGRVSKS